MRPRIEYRYFEDAWNGYGRFISQLIKLNKVKTICEIGGGANPMFSLEYLANDSISYTILDISETELSKAPVGYKKIKADIASSGFVADKKFDMIFSRMLAEHINDAEQFHRNIFSMLNTGGLAVHFFPTLYAAPFFVNLCIPNKISAILLRYFAPRDDFQYAKFPAHYNWCFGPNPRTIQKLERLGYQVLEYWGFFGHGYYRRVRFMEKIHELITMNFLKHPISLFTSYAYIVLQKAS